MHHASGCQPTAWSWDIVQTKNESLLRKSQVISPISRHSGLHTSTLLRSKRVIAALHQPVVSCFHACVTSSSFPLSDHVFYKALRHNLSFIHLYIFTAMRATQVLAALALSSFGVAHPNHTHATTTPAVDMNGSGDDASPALTTNSHGHIEGVSTVHGTLNGPAGK